jgi:hypothetical protein
VSEAAQDVLVINDAPPRVAPSRRPRPSIAGLMIAIAIIALFLNGFTGMFLFLYFHFYPIVWVFEQKVGLARPSVGRVRTCGNVVASLGAFDLFIVLGVFLADPNHSWLWPIQLMTILPTALIAMIVGGFWLHFRIVEALRRHRAAGV